MTFAPYLCYAQIDAAQKEYVSAAEMKFTMFQELLKIENPWEKLHRQ